jgi:energy-coupling factor transport system ATP-binding protein
MDEPSANLDMAATRELAGLLRGLKAAGHTVVVAEHRLYYLMDLAARIVYLNGGRLQAEYAPQQVAALSPERLTEMGLRATELTWAVPPREPAPTGQPPAVAARGLALRVGRGRDLLLRGVGFELRPGEVAALIGPNGVGKTTLARAMCGLAREAGGALHYGGRPVRATRRHRHAWFVMQDTDCQLFAESVMGEMTVGGQEGDEALARAEAILTELDLWAYRERHPASLSGGQKQRLTLAVALMQDTPVLILDEPTSGLDGRNLERVVRCVQAQARRGKAVLIITHDHELVQQACSRAICLRDGGLEADLPLSAATYPQVLGKMMGTG